MSEQFYADEFFAAPGDNSIEVLLPLKGRKVPIRIRSVGYPDRVAANTAAVTRQMDAFGKLSVKSVDEVKALSVMLARTIVSWPFVNRDGSPVPINEDTVLRLLDGGTEMLITMIEALTAGNTEKLAPFVSPSDAPSKAEAEESPTSLPEVSPSV